MEKLFIFGKPVSGEQFTDREKETKRLVANFTHGINTFILSPRRWGKTSLVKKAGAQAASDKLKIVYMDILHCKTREDFMRTFASAILTQTSGKFEELASLARGFLSRVTVGFEIGQDPVNPVSLKLGFAEDGASLEEILRLPENIAKKKKIDLVICIDEFQQIVNFEVPEAFQAELRGIWQHQEHCSYCLFGSRRSTMAGLFDDTSKPFYKFGDIMYLDTIPQSYWTDYIQGKFSAGGKTIPDGICSRICETVKFNSSYVQQLSWYIFQIAVSEATDVDFTEAVSELIDQCSDIFEAKTSDLTAYQMRFLHALADGYEEGLFSSKVVSKYKLGSSANVSIVRKALLDKGLIENDGSKTVLSDPVMALWLKKIPF